MKNIGNSILVIVAMICHIKYELIGLPIVFLLFGLSSWSYSGYSKEITAKYEAEIELLKAKAIYYIGTRKQ